MATIRERVTADGKRRFHAQVRITGFPARTASFPTKRAAERWATTIEAEMIEGRHFRSPEARRRTVGEAIDRYLREQVPKKRAGNMHRHNLPWWKARIGHLRLSDVTPAVLVEQRGKLATETYTRAKLESKRSTAKGGTARRFTRSSSTVNRYLAVLSHVFTIARREWHWTTQNPFDGVGKLGERKGRARFLAPDERSRLLAETSKDPILHAFVVIALSTAARAGELLQLRWRDVELEEDQGRLLFRVTKNAEPRAGWVHGEALRLLRLHGERGMAEADRVFASRTGIACYDYHKPFRAACIAAEVEGFRFHDLRHTAATYLAREGATEQQLKAIGGWKSSVVSRYVHIAAEDAKEVLRRTSAKLIDK